MSNEVIEIVEDTYVIEIDQSDEVLIVEENVVEVIEVAEQGPEGISGSEVSILIATQVISGHRVCLFESNQLTYCDSANTSHAGKAIGLTLNSATIGGNVSIQKSGEVTEPSWNWVDGAALYIGSNGILTQTPTSNGFIQKVGYAISPTKIWIDFKESIILI
jgi:hypothetical protein